jgi:hypothetical protein
VTRPPILKADGRPLRLAGLSEAIEALGLSRDYGRELLARADGPVPVIRLRAGAVYDLDELEAWDAARNKSGGRPRTRTAA